MAILALRSAGCAVNSVVIGESDALAGVGVTADVVDSAVVVIGFPSEMALQADRSPYGVVAIAAATTAQVDELGGSVPPSAGAATDQQ
jgi:hypothetical protein